MAATLTLANVSPNRLLYKLIHTAGEASNIPNAGGASPDLLTDSQGAIHQIANARNVAYGTVGGAALTQAQARSLLLNDGNVAKPQARTMVHGRAGAAAWDVDANVDGDGDPVLTITSSAAGTCYVEIIIDAAIG